MLYMLKEVGPAHVHGIFLKMNPYAATQISTLTARLNRAE